jgi:hypothetical protein
VDLAASSITEFAPAKLNLALHVTGRRADGYHTLESLVVFTRFGDRIVVEAATEDRFSVSGPFAADVPTDDGNLIIQARDLLRSYFVQPPSVLPDISPARGEIRCSAVRTPSAALGIGEIIAAGAISPLAGEMSGRTEGGAKE